MSDPWVTAPTKHFSRCFYCDTPRNFTERGDVESGDGQYGPASRVVLVSCDHCEQAAVLVQEREGSYHREGWDDPVRVWPGAVRSLSSEVPVALRREHEEARQCLEAKAYTASVVMVRRTIEGVCAASGVTERTLQKSLEKMRDNGGLDQRLLEWAQELRVVGNEGAHFTGKQVSREDAQDALAFAEALLDYLYVLTSKFREFTARRSARTLVTPEQPEQTSADHLREDSA